MALRDYLTGEVTTDFADGLLSRREALRRLVLLGLSASAAGALLSACGGDGDDEDAASTTTTEGDRATGTSTSAPTAGSADGAAAAGQEVTFAGPKGDLIGVVATASGNPKGALLVIHENRGLSDHFRQLVARFAADGYTSLVVDLLSEQGGTAKLSDPAAAPAGLAARPAADLVADLKAGVTELQKRAPGAKVGVIGFCFGGGMAWQLVQDGDPRLAAVAPFYGPAPDAPDFTRSKAAVLGVYGELDSRVNATRDRAKSALEAAGLTHDIKTYAGADHAFFNDTGARYHEQAAVQAKADVLAFFGQHLG